jgi:ABC-type multidrug transport system fused ATPase/permease subunit
VRGLSLHVPGGTVCVVVGPPGSGKSALLDALAYAAGAYEAPTGEARTTQLAPFPALPSLARGSVLLQGRPRELWAKGHWRQAVNSLRQKPARFPHLSLAANVDPAAAAASSAAGRDRKGSNAAVGAALVLAGAAHLAAALANSDGAAVGNDLSSEAWAAVALARAVRGLAGASSGQPGERSSAALVLLDEPLGVDSESNEAREVAFMSALVSAAQQQPACAVVVAARSPRLALFADQVAVLGPRGRVVEVGDPEQLAAKQGGHFAHLLQTQADEAAVEATPKQVVW